VKSIAIKSVKRASSRSTQIWNRANLPRKAGLEFLRIKNLPEKRKLKREDNLTAVP
jgi:hypothetical protein